MKRSAGRPPEATGAGSSPASGEPWTALRLARWSGDYLRERGVEEARLDAEHLLAHALGIDRLELYLQHDRPLTREELDRFRSALRRRARREPLQHILGTVPFRELELVCDRRALIPRPETEELVGLVLEWADRERAGRGRGEEAWDGRERAAPPGPPAPEAGASEAGPPEATSAVDPATDGVLEVGTGTGAIALSLAREGSFGRIVATDRDPDALRLARENARRTGLEEGVEFREGNLLEPVRGAEAYGILVSNPPYVGETEWEGLDPEVREWEPRGALVAGSVGLEVIEGLVRRAPDVLRPGGLLALEVGAGQAPEVAALVEATGAFQAVETRKDLSGVLRFVTARRAGPTGSRMESRSEGEG